MALVMTLMVAALLSMLAITFLGLNRVNLKFLGDSQDQLSSIALADTASEYARMRLDSQPDWGIPSGTERPLTSVLNSAGLIVYESEQSGLVRVVGVCRMGHFQLSLQAPGADFQAYQRYRYDSIRQNLADPSKWAMESGPLDQVSVNYSLTNFGVAPLTPPRASRRAVPGGCANLQIEVCTPASLRRVDCTVKRAYIFDASAMSGGVMSVGLSGGNWTVSSSDPATNKIQARSEIVTPTLGSLSFGSKPGAGQALAQKEIYVNGSVTTDTFGIVTGISGAKLSTNAALKASSEAAANGTFSPFNSVLPVPMLRDTQLVSAPGAVSSIPKGLYHFSADNKVSYFSNPASDGSGTPDMVYTDTIPNSAGGGTAVYLKGNKFIVSGKVQVDGDLAVNGTATQRPSLALGYLSDGTLPANAKAGRLEVKGNVLVRAETVGQGTLIAKSVGNSDGAITMEGNSALSATPSQGVAVYADGPVRLEPVPAASAPLDFRSLDWKVYSSGLTQIHKNTSYRYGNSNPLLDHNNILSWTYRGAQTSVGMSSDPFVDGDDSLISLSQPRDQIVGKSNSDVIVQQLRALAAQTKLAANDPLFLTKFNDALDGYLAGHYDNFPQGTNTYPIDAGFTLGRYERLKNMLLESEASPSTWQAAYASWVRTDSDSTSVSNFKSGESMYRNVSTQATLALATTTPTLQAYMSGSDPFAGSGVSPLDVAFKGLIYTHKNLYVRTNHHKFSAEGALVSRLGDMVIQDSTGVSFRYNPTYFDSLLNRMGSSDVSRLQIVFTGYR